jgi:hypothetical protein
VREGRRDRFPRNSTRSRASKADELSASAWLAAGCVRRGASPPGRHAAPASRRHGRQELEIELLKITFRHDDSQQ